MTRDTKLALILGFAILLIVGLLISDHFAVGASPSDAAPGSRFAEATPLARPTPAGETRSLTPSPPITEALAVGPPTDRPTPAGGDFADPPNQLVMGANEDRVAVRQPTPTDDATSDWQDTLEALRNRIQQPAPQAAQTDQYRNGQRVASSPADDDRDQRAQPSPPAQRYPMHLVREGETLWGLAKRYYGDGALHDELADFNRDLLEPDGDLPKDVAIRIPSRSELLGAAPRERRTERDTAADRNDDPPRLVSTRTYTVKKGDVLGTIAQRELGTSKRWEEIFELNKDKLKRPEDIWVGMKLLLPID